jgi:hypothetical protein
LYSVEATLVSTLNPGNSIAWTPIFWAAIHGDLGTVVLFLALPKHNTSILSLFGNMQRRVLKDSTVGELLYDSQEPQLGKKPNDVFTDIVADTSEVSESDGLLEDLHEILKDESLDFGQLGRLGPFDPATGHSWRTNE